IDEAHVTNIAVHPSARGKGYGEAVTRALMQLASDTGMIWMTLEVRRSNLVAQNLYHKVGFVDVGYRKRYYEDNREDALIMACEHLPSPRAHAE
ncbi:MAG: ribosomal protein S18-alanine N-acetyltransferase, partial [Clostridia bacterium]